MAMRGSFEGDVNGKRAQRVEELALRLLETPRVQHAIEKGLQRYLASDVATKPGALWYVKSAAHEVGTLSSLYAAMAGVPDPTFVWVYAPPRKWHGYSLPGSRCYGDNADVMYRALRVDDTFSYELTLHTGDTLAPQLSLMLYDWLLFEHGVSARSDIPLNTYVVTDTTIRNPDGSITLTIGPDPAAGRPNHIELIPSTRQLLFREIRGDWSIPPTPVSVERTSTEAPRSMTIDELAEEAAGYVEAETIAVQQIGVVFGNLLENELGEVRVRWAKDTGEDQPLSTDEVLTPEQALGFISNALFNIDEDEALVMTLNMMGTEYLSVNTYRPYLLSCEHVHGTSSLNNFQAKPNPDGSFTFVLARRDPGVYNWLDVAGIPYGEITIRWQGLTQPVAGTMMNAVQHVEVVQLADLREHVLPTTVWVNADERAEQRANRARLYHLRCMGTPCEAGGALDSPY